VRIDFVNDVALKLGIERKDLIEKDVILHQILSDLSNDTFFSTNFVFKGGTCLIKCYYGYIRFSEDIDFTWNNQRVYRGKSQKQIREYLSSIIDKIGKTFESIANKRELEFKVDKSDRKFVELGSSNKFCTFKLWYSSDVLGKKSFLKVQINFVEQMCFKIKSGKLRSLLTKQYSDLKALYPEYSEYSRAIRFQIYDIREILSEKVRAILTRRGVKARDFVDVYLIQKYYGIKPESIEECTIKKIKFALELYERFKAHFEERKSLLESGEIFEWGTERELLISDIDQKEFYAFLAGFQAFLKNVCNDMS
jgi:predicted nucleotidyltransferase component of viral defense system